MTLDPPNLTRIATAARDVPMHHQGALIHFAQAASPETVLALVERIGKLEADYALTEQKERDLRVALKEALDGWEARDRDVWECTGGDAYGPHRADGRIAELRKLVSE